jgi:hypothetical protein
VTEDPFDIPAVPSIHNLWQFLTHLFWGFITIHPFHPLGPGDPL